MPGQFGAQFDVSMILLSSVLFDHQDESQKMKSSAVPEIPVTTLTTEQM